MEIMDPEKPATPDVPPPAPEAPATPEEPASDVPKENTAVVKDGTMTVVLQFEGDPAAFAKAIGSLELAKDLVKNYFGQKAMADAAIRARRGLIKPTLSN